MDCRRTTCRIKTTTTTTSRAEASAKAEISRRAFATRVGGLAAAAFVVGRDLLSAVHGLGQPRAGLQQPRPRRERSRGARQHRRPRPGQLAEARVRAPAERRDQDDLRHRRQPRRRAHPRSEARRRRRRSSPATCRTCGASSTTRTSTASIIATPNHWHALASIWAMQAGKHVYVEKPASHTVWEGRKMVEAARKYNRIVQVGTMNRSRPAVTAGDQVPARAAASARSTWRAASASSGAPASASTPTARCSLASSTS